MDEERLKPPSRGYGLIDQVELDAESDVVVYWIDVIDREWLEAEGEQDHRFSLRDVDQTIMAWSRFHAKGMYDGMPDPFKKAPLFRLEVHVPAGGPLHEAIPLPRPQGPDDVESIADTERQWIEVEIDPHSVQPNALAYSGLFVEPIQVEVRGKLPGWKVSEALSRIFSLSHLPTIDTAGLECFLGQYAAAEQLAVYDVGQGNANALLRRNYYPPSIYFDLGAGVYKNHPTRPATMRFCFSSNQPVILSHWDMDHWAGACAANYPAGHSPIDSTWIVPLQVVSPIHVAFAYGVATGGGKVLVYNPVPTTVGTAVLDAVTQIRFSRGTGPDKNGSGIVLVVERDISPTDRRSWLLTGDCDYGYFLRHMLPATPVAALVPHHGAKAHTTTAPPTPVAGDYRRLAYSFGPGNRNGRTNVQHPTAITVTAHQAAGWQQIHWTAAPYGNPFPGADTRTTSEHAPGTRRGGVKIGWTEAPILTAAPCSNANCNAVLNQT